MLRQDAHDELVQSADSGVQFQCLLYLGELLIICPSKTDVIWRYDMRLRRTQICSIHHSRFCCGREAIPKGRRQRRTKYPSAVDSWPYQSRRKAEIEFSTTLMQGSILRQTPLLLERTA